MKLLYITNQICGAAGLERVLSIKASALVEQHGFEVHIITLNQGEKPLFYSFSQKIKYHDITAKGNPLKYFKNYLSGIKAKVKEISPDIISVCDDGLKGLLLPILLRKPCPMIYERHVSKEIEKTSEKTSFFQFLKRNIVYKLMYYGGASYDKFIVLTQKNLNEWPLKNMQVINNPLSFNSNIEKSSLKEKIVLAVGRHSYQKGYDRLLSSWKKVVVANSDWKLLIFGKKDNALGLEKMAKEMGLSDSVSFNDPVKNINEQYKKASVFVLPSRYEGFGMVLTEAMVHGVPCVSFDCPYGPSDIIDHNSDGFLVENGDIDAFALQIQKLINSEELRREMGEKAIEKVKKFKPEIVIPQWVTLFKSLKTGK